MGIPPATVGGYLSGRHLPSPSQLPVFIDVLHACGISDKTETGRWVAALNRARAASDARAGRPATAPYPGLRPFEAEDAALFFGRDAAVEEVLAALRRSLALDAPLLVIGASGSGKSSLLRAGVVPRVRDGALDEDEPPAAPCLTITPGQDPLSALEAAVQARPRLLVIDQLEQMLTGEDDDRRQFFGLLSEIDFTTTAVAMALRADFFAAALAQPMLYRAVHDNTVVVAPLTTDELRAAITGPARRSGIAIEGGLVDVILGDLAPRGASGYGHDQGALPLLSHALRETWDLARRNTLTIADYRTAGGIEGAVQQTAEQVYATLDADEAKVARLIFLRLVRVDRSGVVTRRTVALSELESLTDQGTGSTPSDASTGAQVLDRFVASRLITADHDAVQISHEAVLGAWSRLREWLEDDRTGMRLRRQITDATNLWMEADQDDAGLLRGSRLAVAVEWATEPSNRASLNRIERDYLDASVAVRRAELHAEQRHSRLLTQLLVVVAVLAVLAAGLAAFAFVSRNSVDQQRASAQTARDEALSRQVALQATRLRASQPALAAQLALAAFRISPTPQARAALLDSSALPAQTRLLGPPGPMQDVVLNRAGTLLAAPGADGRVHLWSLANLSHPTVVSALGAVDDTVTLFAVAFSPDGRLLAAGGSQHTVALWNVADPAHPRALGSPLSGASNTIYALAFSPDGTTLAAGSADGLVHRWTVTNPGNPVPLAPMTDTPGSASKCADCATGSKDYIQSIAFSPDGSTIIGGTAAGEVCIWYPARSPRPATVLRVAAVTALLSVAYSPTGAIVAGSDTGIVYRWAPASDRFRSLPSLTGFTSWVNGLAFNADGSLLAAGDSDETIRVWSMAGDPAPTLVRTISLASAVTAVTFVPGAQSVAASTVAGVAVLAPLAEPVLTGNNGTYFGLSFDRSGHRLATGSHAVQLWDITTTPPTLLGTVADNKPGLANDGTGALSPDGTLLATATGNNGASPVLLWDVRTPSHPVLLAQLDGPQGIDEAVRFSPDGHTLAEAGDDHLVHLWDISTPAHPVALPSLRGFGNYVYQAIFSSDGSLLATPSADRTVRLWNVRNPAQAHWLSTISGFGSYVNAVALSTDGTMLAAASADKTVRLYDVHDPAHPVEIGGPLIGPSDVLASVAISPDGRQVSAGSSDGTVWVWDISRPKHPIVTAELTAAESGVFSLAYTPDGRYLLGGTSSQTVHRWDADPAPAAAAVCAGSGDSITAEEWTEYVPGVRFKPPCP